MTIAIQTWLAKLDPPPRGLKRRSSSSTMDAANDRTPRPKKTRLGDNTPRAEDPGLSGRNAETRQLHSPPSTIGAAGPSYRRLTEPASGQRRDDSSISASSQSSSNVSGLSSGSKRRRTSESPTKSDNNLRAMVQQSVYRSLREIPEPARRLWADLLKTSEGIGYVPNDASTELKNVVHNEYVDSGRTVPAFLSSDPSPISAIATRDIDRILKRAQENFTREASEAQWNCTVHGPLLQLARESYHSRCNLHIDNMYACPSHFSCPVH